MLKSRSSAQQFRVLQEQQAKVAALSPSMVRSESHAHVLSVLTVDTLQEDADAQINHLHVRIQKQNAKRAKLVGGIEKLIREQLPEQATKQLK